ncbi:MAG: xanthine dehydrogenase subunit D [Kibdelosporangium sp.]
MSELLQSTPTTAGTVGTSARRPDGPAKAAGEFSFAGDLHAEGMLWGATVRSPHPSALIRSIDVAPAWQLPGVQAVLLADDVPGRLEFGVNDADQPVLAAGEVRYVGEAVAVVAADDPWTARRAAAAIVVDYEPRIPLLDPDASITAPPIHPDGNVFRHIPLRRGDQNAVGEIQVEGTYEVGMQDQAPIGTEAGMAFPAEDGGVELHVATQWLHLDRDQVAACLGLPPEQVRLVGAGVGGAFGSKEDLSLQAHLGLLALRTNKPVKMVYSRQESFLGHVHRHPARIWFRHHADRDGRLVMVEGRLLLDGGAYMSTSYHVIANATAFAAGPYRIPNARIDGWAVRTNNPPCGAMRGFGAVQACFAYEAQMDKLAAALDMDPVELRLRNALDHGDEILTSQRIDGTLPVAEVIRQTAALPMPPATEPADPLPGSAPSGGRTHIRRGVGFAVSFKNLMYGEGFDDYSTARCELLDGVATIDCAAVEVGQGFVSLAQQIARTVLGVDEVVLLPNRTATVGTAGSSSASRQTWVSGGAIEAACVAVRDRVLDHVAAIRGVPRDLLELRAGRIEQVGGDAGISLAEVAPGTLFAETREFHHKPTYPLDERGQGDAHVSFACAAHRAVVDVDPELGLVRVVQVATAQDVGRALNPLQVIGQIEGGISQGVGLAVMEEIRVVDGAIVNPGFAGYLIPTTVDCPEVVAALVEHPEPGAPFGAKGAGEPPVVSSTPAVVAAIRAATGAVLPRVPVRPEDIVLRDARRPTGTASAEH